MTTLDESRAVAQRLRGYALPNSSWQLPKDAADTIDALVAEVERLRGALSDVAYGLEGSRIWGGMDWTYNPLHPFKYLPLRDKARAALEGMK